MTFFHREERDQEMTIRLKIKPPVFIAPPIHIGYPLNKYQILALAVSHGAIPTEQGLALDKPIPLFVRIRGQAPIGVIG